MHSVKLILTDAQLKKMKSSNPFQLSHRQLSGQSEGKHEVTLELPESDSRRLVSNVQQGKGFRFNPKKFLRQARNTAKKVGNVARKTGKFVVDNVPKDVVKDVANLAIDKLELPPETKTAVDKGIDIGYKSQGKGTAKAGTNPWIQHVKSFAKQHGINYRDALKHPNVKSSYQKGGKFSLKKLGKLMKPAVPIGKEIAKGALMGLGHKSKQNIHNEGGTLLKGIPKSLNSRATRDHIKTNGLMQGGSFLPLGQ